MASVLLISQLGVRKKIYTYTKIKKINITRHSYGVGRYFSLGCNMFSTIESMAHFSVTGIVPGNTSAGGIGVMITVPLL